MNTQGKLALMVLAAFAVVALTIVLVSVAPEAKAGSAPTGNSLQLLAQSEIACATPPTTPVPTVGDRRCTSNGGGECSCGYYSSGWICGKCNNGCNDNTGKCSKTTNFEVINGPIIRTR